ncbi:DUF551 domain-containing protein [Chromobacterium violaceum]|uniref:DUF551 domain-containing protein n=1 Tax=Chromobacterium violaceum TaxID=536 RepID=UPI001B3240F4|nr:DUF551 domain-containing protein [Chromobacterium violaceum]MBP4048986.1 DUF551 domain-containing protein [Chromobacterium violaceum]
MQTLTQLARAIIAADRAGELTDELFNEFELALDATEQSGEAVAESMARETEQRGRLARLGMLADRLSDATQPVPAVPEGWRKGQFHYQTLFNAIAAATSARAGEPISVSVEAFENAMLAAVPQLDQWLDIDTAPQDGRTILLGYHNSHGNWRTMRGQWFTKECIDDEWEDADCFQAGWYETSVEADDAPSCWQTNPTHWMPLPAAPQPKEGGSHA